MNRLLYLPFLCAKCITALFLVTINCHAMANDQVLARVGDQAITSANLEQAIASSPIAVQFPAMDEKDQAALRGDLLKRLVASRLFYLEARRRGLDSSARYREDAELYRQGYLYRAYMDKLKEGIDIEPKKLEELKAAFKGEPDALQAAQSQELGERYKLRKAMALQYLKEKHKLVIHDDRIAAGAPADTVMAEADNLKVLYGDILKPGVAFNQARFEENLYNKVELLLVSNAAKDEGFKVPMDEFERETLPGVLLAEMEKKWIPSENVMKDYFNAHPELGQIPEQRQITQIVTATREEAEKLRQRILNGESMYSLAAEKSIDPYGARHAGDMGWLSAGSGMPAIEKVLSTLKDGELSSAIETPRGFHLVRIEERKPGHQLFFDAVRDRVHQAIIKQHYPTFLAELQQRYPVEWMLPMSTDEQRARTLLDR